MEKLTVVEAVEYFPQQIKVIADNDHRLLDLLHILSVDGTIHRQGEIHLLLDTDVVNDQVLVLSGKLRLEEIASHPIFNMLGIVAVVASIASLALYLATVGGVG